jgi:hypothetical protein
MGKSKLVVRLGVLALVVASAASGGRPLTVREPLVINGTELKPGDYRVEVNGNSATFRGDKQTLETSVNVEETPAKIPTTTVRYNTSDGKHRVEEIRLGGTKMKLLFGESGNDATAAN